MFRRSLIESAQLLLCLIYNEFVSIDFMNARMIFNVDRSEKIETTITYGVIQRGKE